jgi:hypothetical protein
MAGFIALGVFVAVLVETLTLGRSFDDRHSACTFPSRAPELLLPGSDSTEPCVDLTQGTPRDDRDGARHRRDGGRDAVYLPGLCAPFAMVIGLKSLNAIKAQPHLGGRSEATTGFILGIIATLLLVLSTLFLAFMIWLVVEHPEAFEE